MCGVDNSDLEMEAVMDVIVDVGRDENGVVCRDSSREAFWCFRRYHITSLSLLSVFVVLAWTVRL